MFSSCVLLQEHTENHADDPTQWWTLQLTSNPTTSRDAYSLCRTFPSDRPLAEVMP